MLSNAARREEVPFMKSVNFEFLRVRRAVLADLAGFAERYAHEDPASSLIKQRSFVEHAVAAIYESYRLRPPYSDNLNDLMNETAFRQAVPEVVQNKLHAVRKAGNHAAPATPHHQPALARLLGAALRHRALVLRAARWGHTRGHPEVHAATARAGKRRQDEGRSREAASR